MVVSVVSSECGGDSVVAAAAVTVMLSGWRLLMVMVTISSQRQGTRK
jgi:hypothetical protein